MSYGLLPKALSSLGVLVGVVALFFALVSFLELSGLTLMSRAAAVVFRPTWLIWTGIALGRIKG